MSNSTTSLGQRAADRLTELAGSWLTLGWFSLIIAVYIIWNSVSFLPHFDSYPYMFLTFCVSILANFQAIIVMISQKGQLLRDRQQQEAQHKTAQAILNNTEAGREMLGVLRDYILKELNKEDNIE
jgi:uncharacterized membrane protein